MHKTFHHILTGWLSQTKALLTLFECKLKKLLLLDEELFHERDTDRQSYQSIKSRKQLIVFVSNDKSSFQEKLGFGQLVFMSISMGSS